MKASAKMVQIQMWKWLVITGMCDMYASEDGHMYLEGDTSQCERLEISLGSLHRTQNKTFFTGADVVLPVAVEWTHAGWKAGEIKVVSAACLHDAWLHYKSIYKNRKTPIIMTDDLIQLQSQITFKLKNITRNTEKI